MPVSIWESIANTPWWVYVLYALVFFLCLKARHPTHTSLKQLIFFPLYFLSLAVLCAAYSMHPTLTQVGAGALACSLSAILGWIQFARLPLIFNAKQGTITLPGSRAPLLFLMAATLAKFGLGLSLPSNYQLLNSGAYNTPLFTLYGTVLGLSLGRFAYARQAFKHANA